MSYDVLNITLSRSPMLVFGYVLLWMLACLGIYFLPLATLLKCLFVILITASVGWVIAVQALRMYSKSIVGLSFQKYAHQPWSIQRKVGQHSNMLLKPKHCFVSPFLTVLMLQPATGQAKQKLISVILLPDCIDAEDYRRLRVVLLWQTAQPSIVN